MSPNTTSADPASISIFRGARLLKTEIEKRAAGIVHDKVFVQSPPLRTVGRQAGIDDPL